MPPLSSLAKARLALKKKAEMRNNHCWSVLINCNLGLEFGGLSGLGLAQQDTGDVDPVWTLWYG